MSRKQEPIALPTKAQLSALGDAMLQARFALEQAVSGLADLEGANQNELVMIRLVRTHCEQALAAWSIK